MNTVLMKRVLTWILLIAGVAYAPLATEAVVPIQDNHERIFSRLEVTKTRVFMGEQVPVTISLYITGLNVYKVFTPVLSQPEFEFETVSHLSSSTTVMNNRNYQVIRFKTELTPLKEGAVSLGPVVVNCKLSQNQDEDFESTPDVYRLARGTLETTTPRIKLQVLPLPPVPKGANFSGGIGQFRMTPELIASQPKKGEPLTVRLTVAGSGNIQNISLPVLADETGFQVFPVLRKQEKDHEVVFEQTLVPLDQRLTKIGPYRLTYFDPDARRYRNATASLPVQIMGKPGSNQSTGISKRNIAGIKESVAGLKKENRPLVLQSWFWLLQMIPILLLVLVGAYRHYRQKQQADHKVRLIIAENVAEKRLAAARDMIGREGKDRFLHELYLTLHDLLNARFNYEHGKTLMLEELSATLEGEVSQTMQSFLNQYQQIRFTNTELTTSQAEHLWKMVREIVLIANQTAVSVKEITQEQEDHPAEEESNHGEN